MCIHGIACFGAARDRQFVPPGRSRWPSTGSLIETRAGKHQARDDEASALRRATRAVAQRGGGAPAPPPPPVPAFEVSEWGQGVGVRDGIQCLLRSVRAGSREPDGAQSLSDAFVLMRLCLAGRRVQGLKRQGSGLKFFVVGRASRNSKPYIPCGGAFPAGKAR